MGPSNFLWLGNKCDHGEIQLFCWNMIADVSYSSSPAMSIGSLHVLFPISKMPFPGFLEMNIILKVLQNIVIILVD